MRLSRRSIFAFLGGALVAPFVARFVSASPASVTVINTADTAATLTDADLRRAIEMMKKTQIKDPVFVLYPAEESVLGRHFRRRGYKTALSKQMSVSIHSRSDLG